MRLPEREDQPTPQTHSAQRAARAPGGLRRATVYKIAAAFVLLALVGLAAFSYSRGSATPPRDKPVAGEPKTEDRGRPSPEPPAKHETVEVAGGEFMMGRGDVSLATANAYDLNQWPAHRVEVRSFFISRTEVTNEEYAEFVREENYAAPAGWEGAAPPAGQARWPVRNVSHHDAEHFAEWRSKRDGVAYRLPTEEEWEYAARGGGKYRLYPWGDEWAEGRAHVEADSPRDVGPRQEGAAGQAPADMIGNVWEWTSSVVSLYPGNRYLQIPAAQKDDIVVRGGSYQSKARGAEAITATRRQWVPPATKQPHIGFRLVREAAPRPQGG